MAQNKVIKSILERLGITQKELREICVLSGTDYNYNIDGSKNAPTLYKTLSHFKKYHKDKSNLDFYDWLIEKTNYITDYDILQKIHNMFDINKKDNALTNFENIKIINTNIVKGEIREILKTDGFIFAEDE